MARIKYTEAESQWLEHLVGAVRRALKRQITGLGVSGYAQLRNLERTQLSKTISAERSEPWMVPFGLAALKASWRTVLPTSVEVPGPAGRDPDVLTRLAVDRLRALAKLGELPAASAELRRTDRYKAALAGEASAWMIPTLLAALLPQGPKD